MTKRRSKKQPQPKNEPREEVTLTSDDDAVLDRIWGSDAIRNLKPRPELLKKRAKGS